jgi:nucleoside-diphosphate-sugar epimerase
VLWSYVDSRDAAVACRLAVETVGLGALVVNVAADENRLDVPSRNLMAEHYPTVGDFRAPLEGYESLLSNALAKERLGWSPQYRWRDLV